MKIINFLIVFFIIFSTSFITVYAGAVYNGKLVEPAFDAMRSSRVDVVGIGDSNQLKNGTGWDDGFQFALNNKYGIYATALLSANENNGSGAQMGYGYVMFVPKVTGVTTSAPAALDDYLNKGLGNLAPANYAYLSTSTATSSGQNSSYLILSAGGAIGTQQAITAQYFYGLFPKETTNAGKFKPTVRLGASGGFSVLASPTTIYATSTSSSYSMAETDLALSASSTRGIYDLDFMWSTGAGIISGPWFGLYMRAYVPSKTTGVSYHTLYGLGSQSLEDMAYALKQSSDTTLSYYFSQVRSLQSTNIGSATKVVIVVNSGVNDRTEVLPSVGLNATNSSLDVGYADNLEALVDRIKYIWDLNGWDPNELYFICIPSHPYSEPEDSKLTSYRNIAKQVSDLYNTRTGSAHANLAVIDMTQLPISTADTTQLASSTYIASQGWYYTGQPEHLVVGGYENLSTMIINSLSADVIAPNVTITSPANAYVASSTISITATSTDNIGLAGVTFYANSTVIGSEITSVSSPDTYTTTLDTSSLVNGPYLLTAVSRDTSGNYATSTPISITVQNDVSVDITAPTNGSSVNGSVTVTASASALSGVAGIHFLIDGTNYGSEVTSAPYTITWNSAGYADGLSHTILAVTRDNTGNYATSSAITVTVPDNINPKISLISPSNLATLSGSVLLVATSTDNVGVAGVTFYANSTVIGSEITSTTSPDTYTTTLDASSLVNGSYSLTAVSRDTSGNYATSTAVNINVNNPVATSRSHTGHQQTSFANSSSAIKILPSILLSILPSKSPTFNRNLEKGMTGDDVKLLQAYLNTHGYLVASSGSGSLNFETRFFGIGTKSALIKFQKDKGIVPSIGYFGQKTQQYISSH